MMIGVLLASDGRVMNDSRMASGPSLTNGLLVASGICMMIEHALASP